MSLYQNNRQNLIKTLNGKLALVLSNPELIRNSDVHYLFRQDSDFLYLTGIEGPNHKLIVDGRTKRSHLFIPDLSEMHQIWEGRQIDAAAAKKIYKTDFVHYQSEFEKILASLKKNHQSLLVLPHQSSAAKALAKSSKLKIDDKTLRSIISELRIKKSEQEINLMRQANEISHDGHVTAMKICRPGMTENQVQAAMEAQFIAGGARHQAYPSIVAAGGNAAILHYRENNAPCKNGDLLLIDAGAEYNGYAADITRTFPINGKFSKKQREIYDLVLTVQKECIAMIRPGVSILDIHLHACETTAQGLIDLGLYHKGVTVQDLVLQGGIRYFFPHGIGHLIGLDVHDVGGKPQTSSQYANIKLRASRVLEAGMAITVEPGIYFIDAFFRSAETKRKTKKLIDWKKAESYREVGGIRIEDDIVVTSNAHLNLTTVPKEVRDIEKLMRR